jgi:AcrR family transcriptional regulator
VVRQFLAACVRRAVEDPKPVVALPQPQVLSSIRGICRDMIPCFARPAPTELHVPKVVDHDARRRDFIKAAYETITESGLANTTVRAVARKAGYTTGALVHYFGDKEELIRLALDYSGDVVRDRMQAAHRQQRGRKALREIILEALPLDKQHSANWRVWLALWYHSENDANMRREEKRRYREWTGRLQRVLEESVDDRELPLATDVLLEVQGLIAFIDGLGVQHLMSSRGMSAKRLTTLLDRYLDRLYVSKR